jgi:hypothetical protein
MNRGEKASPDFCPGQGEKLRKVQCVAGVARPPARLPAAREDQPDRTILVHQLLAERRFFAQFVGTEEPPVEELLPAGEKPVVRASIEKYVWLVKQRLRQLAQGTAAWWLGRRPFFGGLRRERIWVFWRRVLHTCHHGTQVQTWLRLAGYEPVPSANVEAGTSPAGSRTESSLA